MTRVSSVDNNFIRQVSYNGWTKEKKKSVVDKNGTADSMLRQKSGPALAGPAAPATTALEVSKFGKQSCVTTKLVL